VLQEAPLVVVTQDRQRSPLDVSLNVRDRSRSTPPISTNPRALTIAGVHLHGRRPVLTPYVSDSTGRAQEGRSRSSRWKVSGVATRDTVALWLGPTNCTSYVDATVLWVVGASHVPARSRPTVPDNGAPYDGTSPGPQMPSPPRPSPPPLLRRVHSAIGRLVLLSSRMYTRIPSPISADATLRPQLSY
jgi:hypothetical protein